MNTLIKYNFIYFSEQNVMYEECIEKIKKILGPLSSKKPICKNVIIYWIKVHYGIKYSACIFYRMINESFISPYEGEYAFNV